jgi:hypothetical protein
MADMKFIFSLFPVLCTEFSLLSLQDSVFYLFCVSTGGHLIAAGSQILVRVTSVSMSYYTTDEKAAVLQLQHFMEFSF